MKTTIISNAAVLSAACLFLPLAARAEDLIGVDMTRCDKVAEAVRVGVEKEPQKVLLIVEDAMVANESCACEIVKAAILGSNANPELARQIALTATHIAPKMAAIIAECAGSAMRHTSPGSGKEVVESVRQAIDVQPDTGWSEPVSGGSDYSMTPSDIRGVYLIQPSTGGITTTTTTPPNTSTKIIIKRVPPRRSIPQSPSVAQGP